MNINVLDCSTWNSNQLMHPMCEYIYAHVYMSMHSLHWCDVSRIAVLIFWSQCIFQCVVSYFSVLSRRTACFAVANAYCFIKKTVFFFCSPYPEWTSVQSASTEYCLIFDNHFLFSETLIMNSICYCLTKLQYNLNRQFFFSFSSSYFHFECFHIVS